MQSATLCSGKEMPLLGLGTWPMTGGECVSAVAAALRLGYRHIDTAVGYHNHKDVGRGLRDSGVERADVFVTTKIMDDRLRHDDVLRDCDQSLRDLGIDHIDLLLIHWPNREIPLGETLRTFRRLLDDGRIRHAGVSNFTVRRLGEAIAAGEVPIAVNQVEYHPYLNQQELLDCCTANDVVLTAYSPLARGQITDDEVLVAISRRYGKSPLQVALRWMLQKSIVVIPKASSEAHLRANMDIFGWELSAEEMTRIDAIPKRVRLIESPLLEP